jgi:hypothetical protein
MSRALWTGNWLTIKVYRLLVGEDTTSTRRIRGKLPLTPRLGLSNICIRRLKDRPGRAPDRASRAARKRELDKGGVFE